MTGDDSSTASQAAPATPAIAEPQGLAASRRTATGVTVVDLGSGNLWNVERALRHLGAEVEVTTAPDRIAAARILVLPGVGAFVPAREGLRGEREAALRQAVAGGAWLLGICLGFQLLFDGSEEFGATDGLGLLPGRITRLPDTVPVPHIGWNRLHDLRAHPLLTFPRPDPSAALGMTSVVRAAHDPWQPPAGNEPQALGTTSSPALRTKKWADAKPGPVPPYLFFYFVHSFAPEGVPDELTLARCTHGRPFAAIVARGRVLGTQFHPERSGPAGLRLLSNFLEISGALARREVEP